MMNSSKIQLVAFAFSASVTASASTASDTLTMTVGGAVTESCTIAGGAIDRPVALNAAGSDSLDFAVECNVPIKVTLTSDRGAFALDADKTPEHSSDYTSFVDYTAGFTLPIGGSNWAVTGQPGSTLKSGKEFTPTAAGQQNAPPFDATLTLAMNWDAPIAGLLAGTYRETITITVTGQD